MKSRYLAGLTIGLCMIWGGCSDNPASPADTAKADLKSLKDTDVALNSDLAARDLEKVLSHYADDAAMLPPNAPLMKGKEAIRSNYRELLADPNMSFAGTTVSTDVSKSGDMAYTQGLFALTGTNPKTKKTETVHGKYVTIFKKQADGTWKVVQDINNADAAPVSAADGKPQKNAAVARKAPAPRKKK